MRIPSEVCDQLALRFGVLLPHLNERQQRLALAAEARLLGHGGVRAVARAAGVSETTVRKGVFELEPPTVLAHLFAVSKDTIRRTTSEIRQLMDQHAHTPRPPAAHLNTLAGPIAHATTHDATLTKGTKPAC